jgi:hypothetical protein
MAAYIYSRALHQRGGVGRRLPGEAARQLWDENVRETRLKQAAKEKHGAKNVSMRVDVPAMEEEGRERMV